jgi:F-type H+-transporting ATPase subunit alpha
VRIREVLKQEQHHPIEIEDQIAIFYALTHGHLDDVAVEDIREFERQFIPFLHQSHQGLRNAIMIQRHLSPELQQTMDETITEFKQREFIPRQG